MANTERLMRTCLPAIAKQDGLGRYKTIECAVLKNSSRACVDFLLRGESGVRVWMYDWPSIEKLANTAEARKLYQRQPRTDEINYMFVSDHRASEICKQNIVRTDICCEKINGSATAMSCKASHQMNALIGHISIDPNGSIRRVTKLPTPLVFCTTRQRTADTVRAMVAAVRDDPCQEEATDSGSEDYEWFEAGGSCVCSDCKPGGRGRCLRARDESVSSGGSRKRKSSSCEGSPRTKRSRRSTSETMTPPPPNDEDVAQPDAAAAAASDAHADQAPDGIAATSSGDQSSAVPAPASESAIGYP